MKKVDLSEQSFNSVGITFKGTQYKLFHGDENDNIALQNAFPQYFEKGVSHEETIETIKPTETEEPLKEVQSIPEHNTGSEKEVNEEESGNEEESEDEAQQDNIREDEALEVYEGIPIKDVIPVEFPDIIKWSSKPFFKFPNVESWSDINPATIIEDIKEDDLTEAEVEHIIEEIEHFADEQTVEESTLITTENSALDTELAELKNQLENKDKIIELELLKQELAEVKKVGKQPSKFEVFMKDLTESVSNIVSGTLDFVMSLRFIVMLSMLMIAGSAISFDIDGWQETYHRLGTAQVTFIIISLYVAKMAIIKILSVGVDKESIIGDWTDKLAFYFNHYMLRMVLITSLAGMVFVSAVGIYSSLAVNTVGDAKAVGMGDSKIAFIDKRILAAENRILTTKGQIPELEQNIKTQLQALEDSVPLIQAKIEMTKKTISELPSNYKTKKRNLQATINDMQDEIFSVQGKKNDVVSAKAGKIAIINAKVEKIQDEKDLLETEKQTALVELNDKQTGETNKALNFTAELLDVTLIELLKFINLLMTFVLEITYLALTWLVVRIDKYSIRKT